MTTASSNFQSARLFELRLIHCFCMENYFALTLLQALSHVTPVRNYFLREENYKTIKRPPGDQLSLVPHRFGELMRKLWNPRNFKTHVSPHEMLQAVVLCSKKKFQITKQGWYILIAFQLTYQVCMPLLSSYAVNVS